MGPELMGDITGLSQRRSLGVSGSVAYKANGGVSHPVSEGGDLRLKLTWPARSSRKRHGWSTYRFTNYPPSVGEGDQC